MFLLGYLIGLSNALLVFVVLIFLREKAERKIETLVRTVERLRPENRGFIIEPESDATAARIAHVEENRKNGKDTPLSELL